MIFYRSYCNIYHLVSMTTMIAYYTIAYVDLCDCINNYVMA